MKCELQNDGIESSQKEQLPKPDSDCVNKYRNSSDIECEKVVKRKMRQKLSSYCSELIKSTQTDNGKDLEASKGREKTCKKEMLAIEEKMIPEMLKCSKMPDGECKRQMEADHLRMWREADKSSDNELRLYLEFMIPLK